MFALLLLGYLVALPAIVPLVVRSAGTLQGYTVSVLMISDAKGHLQVFYDSDAGFSEPRSAAVPLQISDAPREYRVGLPAGRYQRLRIDPGTLGARYVLLRIAILAPDGTVHTIIPLDALVPTHLAILEIGPDRLVVHAPDGLSDPQLLYVPKSPIAIPRVVLTARVIRFLATIALFWLTGVCVAWLIERALGSRHTALARGVTRVPAMFERRPRLAVWGAAAVATSIATYPVLFSGRSLVSPNNGFVRLLYHEVPYLPASSDVEVEDVRGNDVGATMLQGIPHSLIQREALARGEAPLWNRYHLSGVPLWAQGLTFLLDPLHWVTLAVPDPAIGWDLKLVAHRFVFAAGIGLVSLAITGAWLPAIIVAAATPFIGVFTFRFNHPAFFALTYAPWVLLAWFQLAVATGRRSRVLASMLLAISSALVLFASIPKEGALVLLAVHATGILTTLLSSGGWQRRSLSLFSAALAGVAAVLLTTPHWLLFLDNLKQSVTLYDTPNVDFAGRAYAVGFFLSPLAPGVVRPGLHLLGLVLLVSCLTAPRRLFAQRAVLASACVAGALVAVAFGALPASWLIRIPFVRNVGHLHDVLLTSAVPLLLIVCAAGAVELITMSAARAGGAALVVGAACGWLYSNVRTVARDDGFEPWAVLLLAPVAIAMPVAFQATKTRPLRLLTVVAAVSAALVLVVPGGLHLESGLIPLDSLLLQPRPRVDLLARSPAIDAIHGGGEPVRTLGLDWVLHSGSQALYGLESIGGPDPLRVPAYRELLAGSHIRESMGWFTEIRVAEAAQFAAFMDVLNVGYCLVRADAVADGLVDIPLSGADRITLGRRPSAWPRAFFVDGVAVHSDAADLLGMAAAARKPLAAIQSGDLRAADAVRTLRAPTGLVIPADAYVLTSNSTSFHLWTPAPGVAVLTETFLPEDFRTTLNGQRVPYFRVNQAFKGIAIPAPGNWTVTFEYRPRYWDLSLAMAALGVACLAGVALTTGRRR